MNNKHPETSHRHKLNPILTAENWPYLSIVYLMQGQRLMRWRQKQEMLK